MRTPPIIGGWFEGGIPGKSGYSSERPPRLPHRLSWETKRPGSRLPPAAGPFAFLLAGLREVMLGHVSASGVVDDHAVRAVEPRAWPQRARRIGEEPLNRAVMVDQLPVDVRAVAIRLVRPHAAYHALQLPLDRAAM